METVLGEFGLEGVETPGHKLHEEVLAKDVNGAFPNLWCLSVGDGNSRDDSQSEDVEDEDMEEEGDAEDESEADVDT